MAHQLFSAAALDDSEFQYKQLTLAPGQRQIVEGIGAVITKYLDIRPMAIRGFIWFSIREWQMKNKRKIEELQNSTPEDRIQSVGYMFGLLKEKLIRILVNKADKEIIENAVDNAFQFYKTNFANR